LKDKFRHFWDLDQRRKGYISFKDVVVFAIWYLLFIILLILTLTYESLFFLLITYITTARDGVLIKKKVEYYSLIIQQTSWTRISGKSIKLNSYWIIIPLVSIHNVYLLCWTFWMFRHTYVRANKLERSKSEIWDL
jgi:hypothetical protein